MGKKVIADTTLYCSECGGTNVELLKWVNPNTDEIGGPWSCDPDETEDCWCHDCEEHTRLMTLNELWDKLGDIPVNNDDEIEEDFLGFPAGTSKFDVWHWFDERCPNGVAEDLMYNEENEYN